MRGRNRSNKGPNPLTRSYESNGPDVKIRGTAQHIAEKYTQLARDAQSSGDPVAAENYLQHAEHYFRIIATAQEQLREQFGYQPRFEDENEDEGAFPAGERFEDADPGSQPQPFEARPERAERPEGGERQPRFDRGDRRERFQRERGPRPEFQQGEARSDRGERQDRPDRFERGDRPERNEFRRDRRRFETEEGEATGAGLPAFLTNPVRPPPASTGGEETGAEAPVENRADGEPNGDYRTRRRRRRTRFGAEEAENGAAEFTPDVIETPAAE